MSAHLIPNLAMSVQHPSFQTPWCDGRDIGLSGFPLNSLCFPLGFWGFLLAALPPGGANAVRHVFCQVLVTFCFRPFRTVVPNLFGLLFHQRNSALPGVPLKYPLMCILPVSRWFHQSSQVPYVERPSTPPGP